MSKTGKEQLQFTYREIPAKTACNYLKSCYTIVELNILTVNRVDSGPLLFVEKRNRVEIPEIGKEKQEG